jgi:hypothetical protein
MLSWPLAATRTKLNGGGGAWAGALPVLSRLVMRAVRVWVAVERTRDTSFFWQLPAEYCVLFHQLSLLCPPSNLLLASGRVGCARQAICVWPPAALVVPAKQFAFVPLLRWLCPPSNLHLSPCCVGCARQSILFLPSKLCEQIFAHQLFFLQLRCADV